MDIVKLLLKLEQIDWHKKVLRIMKKMGITGLYCRKRCNTSIKEKKHKIYPYLLKDLIICRVNQVWATDITYIMIEGKFVYFVAIMDLYSRYIIAHSLSPYLDAGFYSQRSSKTR